MAGFTFTPELARAFVAACRAHGHRVYVDTGRIGIHLAISEPTAPPEPHPVAGCVHPLGFDTEPFSPLLNDRSGEAARLVAAAIEVQGDANV